MVALHSGEREATLHTHTRNTHTHVIGGRDVDGGTALRGEGGETAHTAGQVCIRAGFRVWGLG